jgi:hypothetical protein
MKILSIVIALLTVGVLGSFAPELPVPPDTPQRLFYIQRSNNAHTVIYDANWLPGSRTLNAKDPVKVYWIRYADRGQIEPLTYMQRTLAYGVETRPVAGGYEMLVVAFKKRTIKVLPNGGEPVATMTIAGKEAALKRIFVQLADNSCMIPKVAYVELFGRDLQTGRATYERFVP